MELIISTIVKAPIEVVYQVLRDVESYPQMFEYMKELHVISEEGNELIADVLEDMFGFHKWVRARFIFEPPTWIEIRQISGPFRSAVGWFELQPREDGTELIHGARIRVGGIVGIFGRAMLRSGEAEARMRQEIAAVKRRAEALVNKQTQRLNFEGEDE